MSEELVEELEEVFPSKEEGSFYVSQIAPTEAEEEVKPQVKETAEGEDETGEDAEDDSNTYQTEPTVTVNPKAIGKKAQKILEDRLKDKEYNAPAMKKAAMQISFLIREEVKRMHFDRYRIVVHVTVGEKSDQDVLMNFLYLWKPEHDHYAIAKYENSAFFANVLIFLIYKQ